MAAGDGGEPGAPQFCERCGQRYGEAARFCGGCGAPVPERPIRANGTPSPPVPSRRISPVKIAGGILAGCLVLFSFLGQESQREATIDFIDRNLYAPVEAINPRNTIAEFYGRVYRSCTVDLGTNLFTGERQTRYLSECPNNHPLVMLTRVPGAILGTASYVLSQGLVAVVVVGIPTLLFLGMLVFGVAEEKSVGVLLNPLHAIFTWLVAYPLFTGLFAWAAQLLILALLLALKSLIAALAFVGLIYLVFEKFKLWEEMRSLFDRGLSRLGRRQEPQRAP